MTNVEVVSSHNFEEKKEEKPVVCMPFGKYKMMPFQDIAKITEVKNGRVIETGKQYLQWLNSQSFLKENLKKAIEPFIK